MLRLTIKASDLNKAMSISSLALCTVAEKINSHALFIIKSGKASIYSSDGNDKLSFSSFPVESDAEMKFTLDPKNVLALLKTSNADTITIESDGTKVSIYASEENDAYISMPSFDPKLFLTFENQLKKTVELATVNAFLLSMAINFELGFILQDENQKCSNLYISDGVFYGTNGSTKIGLFKSDDFSKLGSLIIRRSILPLILNFIEKSSVDEILIKENEKLILLTSPDSSMLFGFSKSAAEIPKMFADAEVPNSSKINVNRAMFLKKLNRLSIGARGDRIIIDMSINNNIITMTTRADYRSVEKMQCKQESTKPINFIMECKLFKDALEQFKTHDDIDLYIQKEKNRCTLYSSASLIINDKIKKPFTSKAVISLPREALK